MAVLTELRNSIRSGNISISGSRQHKDFDEYLISKEEWNEIQPGTSELAVSLSAHEYLEERTSSLLKRLKWVSNHIGELNGVSLENGRLHLSRLEKIHHKKQKNLAHLFMTYFHV